MQLSGINWAIFGWCMIGALLFGILYAALIRWVSQKDLVGQTAWSVVFGVAATLLIMVPVFGIDRVSLIFCFFAASGLPMIVEYLARVQAELHRDKQKAEELNRELLNGHEAESR